MKRIIPYLFIASYFFAFLIKEWNFKILAYDRLYPQILFLSGVNFLSLIYFYQKDHLKGLVDKTVKNKLVISYLNPEEDLVASVEVVPSLSLL